MGLSQALSTAMSGLRATQASLSLVSSNVANAETPGYVRKTLNQDTGTTGQFGSSVLITGVNRQLDEFLQTQLQPQRLQQACDAAGHPLTLRLQPGYDHSYYFISTFMADHLRWHAARLKA